MTLKKHFGRYFVYASKFFLRLASKFRGFNDGKSLGSESTIKIMKAKKFIRQKKQNNKITEPQFGVILEDIQDKFETVIEGHTVLDKKIDNIGGELHEFKKETNEKFGVVFGFIDETRKFIDETSSNFKSVFEYLSRIDKNCNPSAAKSKNFVCLWKRKLILNDWKNWNSG